MIPKIIHYCWFGPAPLPSQFKSYIIDWGEKMPEYQLILWDDKTLPFNIPYVKNAYKHKKWANLSNFIRLHALYQIGGIYLDTDIEVIKSFDQLLDYPCFIGLEEYNPKTYIANNAVIGAIQHHKFIKKCKDYLLLNFDGSEKAYLSSPILSTSVLRSYNIQDIEHFNSDIKILPPEYFYPSTWQEPSKIKITTNTITIHHWSKTWIDKNPPRNRFIKLRAFAFKITPSLFKKIYLYGFHGYRIIQKGVIIGGPFKGLRYNTNQAWGSKLMPKIIGSYECCLTRIWYEFIDNNYSQIINIGCAEGYYIIGTASLFRNCKILGFDISEKAIQLAKLNIKLNNLSNVILSLGEFDPYENESLDSPTLLICDIEGSEINLFNNGNNLLFNKSDMIIELHNFIDFKSEAYLSNLFFETHTIEIIKQESINYSIFQYLSTSRVGKKILNNLDEERPEKMKWMVLRSKLIRN
ncbi:MAG: glycosyltransferase [Saprospiraceae bacterium]